MEFDRECTIRLKAPPELYMEAILERNVYLGRLGIDNHYQIQAALLH